MSGILIVHQFENMIINVLGCTLTLLFYMCPQLWRYLCSGYKLDPVSSVCESRLTTRAPFAKPFFSSYNHVHCAANAA